VKALRISRKTTQEEKDFGPRIAGIATNEEKKSSLLIAARMASSRSRGKQHPEDNEFALAISFFSASTLSAGRSGQGKSVKIRGDSWIKVLILIHVFCSEP
jgi:hypothetical protein